MRWSKYASQNSQPLRFACRSATFAGFTNARVTVPRPISAAPLCAVTRNLKKRTMLDVNGRAYADPSFIAIPQHGIGGGPLHQTAHMGRGIHRRQGLVVGIE